MLLLQAPSVENLREQFEVQKGTLLFVKLGTFYGQGIRTMAALPDVSLTEAGLVMVDFLNLFLPSASCYDLISVADE